MQFLQRIRGAAVFLSVTVMFVSCRTSNSSSTANSADLSDAQFLPEFCGINGFESFNPGTARQVCIGKADGLYPFALHMKVDGKPDSLYEIREIAYESDTRQRLMLARNSSQVGELSVDFRQEGNKEIYEHISGTLEGIVVDLSLLAAQSGQPHGTPDNPSSPAADFVEKLLETCKLVSKPDYKIGLYSSNNPNAKNFLRITKGQHVVYERVMILRSASELQASNRDVPENLVWHYDVRKNSGAAEIFVLGGTVYRYKPTDQNTGATFIGPVTMMDLSEKVDGQIFKDFLSCQKAEN